MEEKDLFQNDVFHQIDKDKVEFLKNFQNSDSFQSSTQMASYLMQAMNMAKEKNIQFDDSETDLLFQFLKAKLPPAEQRKADMIRNLVLKRKRT